MPGLDTLLDKIKTVDPKPTKSPLYKIAEYIVIGGMIFGVGFLIGGVYVYPCTCLVSHYSVTLLNNV